MEHSKRVTAFSIAISKILRLPRRQIEIVARGAFLHDIGKMAIPDDILRKPSALTADEFAIIKEHCVKGYEVVHRVPLLAIASDIVLYHHERYDGTGYPRGLKGAEIPQGSRIVAVANALDTITSDQPYRSAQSFASARTEIQHWSGRQFDPEIVDAFQQLPDGVFQRLRNDIIDGSF